MNKFTCALGGAIALLAAATPCMAHFGATPCMAHFGATPCMAHSRHSSAKQKRSAASASQQLFDPFFGKTDIIARASVYEKTLMLIVKYDTKADEAIKKSKQLASDADLIYQNGDPQSGVLPGSHAAMIVRAALLRQSREEDSALGEDVSKINFFMLAARRQIMILRSMPKYRQIFTENADIPTGFVMAENFGKGLGDLPVLGVTDNAGDALESLDSQ